jgi:hypothetical protein
LRAGAGRGAAPAKKNPSEINKIYLKSLLAFTFTLAAALEFADGRRRCGARRCDRRRPGFSNVKTR